MPEGKRPDKPKPAIDGGNSKKTSPRKGNPAPQKQSKPGGVGWRQTERHLNHKAARTVATEQSRKGGKADQQLGGSKDPLGREHFSDNNPSVARFRGNSFLVREAGGDAKIRKMADEIKRNRGKVSKASQTNAYRGGSGTRSDAAKKGWQTRRSGGGSKSGVK